MTRGALAIAALLLLAASARAEDLWPDLSSADKAVGGGEKDAAVVVGAEKYAFVEHVPGARRNAEDWQAYLTETLKVPFERVALLRDDDATVEEVREAARKAAAQVRPGGRLWFVFIGHGAPSKDGKDGLLVGVDAQQKAQSVYARSLSRNELLAILSKGKQARAVVVLDACFSGRSSSGGNLVAGLQPLVTMGALPAGLDPRTVLMTAGRADQFAGPLPRAAAARPAFSYLALGALRGWAADEHGQVTAKGVVEFTRRALTLARDRVQTPELAAGNPDALLSTGRESAPNLARIDRADSSEPAKEPGPPASKTRPRRIKVEAAPSADLTSEGAKLLYLFGTKANAEAIKSIKPSPTELDVIMAGQRDAMSGSALRVDAAAYAPKLNDWYKTRMGSVAQARKGDEASFLKDQAAQATKTLSNGALYFEERAGGGGRPSAADTVKVNYEGKLVDGSVFDSSYTRGQPASFPLNAVIPCWTAGMQEMRVGGKAKLICPSSAAYGDQGHPPVIPGGATLIFEVELLGVETTRPR